MPTCLAEVKPFGGCSNLCILFMFILYGPIWIYIVLWYSSVLFCFIDVSRKISPAPTSPKYWTSIHLSFQFVQNLDLFPSKPIGGHDFPAHFPVFFSQVFSNRCCPSRGLERLRGPPAVLHLHRAPGGRHRRQCAGGQGEGHGAVGCGQQHPGL